MPSVRRREHKRRVGETETVQKLARQTAHDQRINGSAAFGQAGYAFYVEPEGVWSFWASLLHEAQQSPSSQG